MLTYRWAVDDAPVPLTMLLVLCGIAHSHFSPALQNCERYSTSAESDANDGGLGTAGLGVVGIVDCCRPVPYSRCQHTHDPWCCVDRSSRISPIVGPRQERAKENSLRWPSICWGIKASAYVGPVTNRCLTSRFSGNDSSYGFRTASRTAPDSRSQICSTAFSYR